MDILATGNGVTWGPDRTSWVDVDETNRPLEMKKRSTTC